jgi:hypothetical protein
VGFGNLFQWPSADVVARLRDFRLSDLGIIARLGKAHPSARESVAPVVFYQSKPPAMAHGYVFAFRLREDAKLAAEVYPEQGAEAIVRKPFPRLSGGRPFVVKWDAGEAIEGYYKLLLKGYFLSTNDPIVQTVRFYHRPRISDE